MPVAVTAGIRAVSSAVQADENLNIFGIDGPVTSASRMAVFSPARCAIVARRPVTRDLPTPPLPDTTAITLRTTD